MHPSGNLNTQDMCVHKPYFLFFLTKAVPFVDAVHPLMMLLQERKSSCEINVITASTVSFTQLITEAASQEQK